MTTFTVDISKDFDLVCARCGDDLKFSERTHNSVTIVNIVPCVSCLKVSDEEGYERAVNEENERK